VVGREGKKEKEEEGKKPTTCAHGPRKIME
jgi:hypothetical protein